MINHTTNPAERATSIADCEAEKVWKETGSYKEYLRVWLSVYRQSLLELVYSGDVQTN